MTAQELVQEALKARERAYVPYSKFKVGAALLATEGRVYYGCNIENASYGATNCAERTAVFSAIAEGVTNFSALAVVADTTDPCAPCGVCRQVLVEFLAPDTAIYLANVHGDIEETNIKQLLPGAFTKKQLKREF